MKGSPVRIRASALACDPRRSRGPGLQNELDYVIDTVDESVSTDVQYRAAFGKGTEVVVDLSEVP